MHYYQFNIGDYTSHTRGLSLLEDLAYRRLLDAYYVNERPFNGCSTDVAREIGMRNHEDEVEYVLGRFFPQNEQGEWVNKRAEKEIKGYKKKKEAASAAGRASGKTRKNKEIERTFNGRSTKSNEPSTNHKPLTNNQEPIVNASANAEEGKPSGLSPAVNGCPYQKILDLYHEALPMLPRVRMLTEKRKTHMRRRWQNEFPDLETWGKFFTDVSKSKFLIGQAQPSPGRRPFQADIDWLLKPDNIAKVAEGKYDG